MKNHKCIVTYFWRDEKRIVHEGKITVQIPDYIFRQGKEAREQYAVEFLSKELDVLIEIRTLVTPMEQEFIDGKGVAKKEVKTLLGKLSGKIFFIPLILLFLSSSLFGQMGVQTCEPTPDEFRQTIHKESSLECPYGQRSWASSDSIHICECHYVIMVDGSYLVNTAALLEDDQRPVLRDRELQKSAQIVGDELRIEYSFGGEAIGWRVWKWSVEKGKFIRQWPDKWKP